MEVDLKATIYGKKDKGHLTVGVYNEMGRDGKPIYYVTLGIRQEDDTIATLDVSLDDISKLNDILWELSRVR